MSGIHDEIKQLKAVLNLQGVHLDVIAIADEIGKDCPKWADFMLRMKERAIYNNNEAKKFLT